MEAENRKERILYLRNIIEDVGKELRELMEGCSPHQIIRVRDSAKCDVCGQYFGWWCPNSPFGVCDYERENGDYNEDCCRYCGDPEERK